MFCNVNATDRISRFHYFLRRLLHFFFTGKKSKSIFFFATGQDKVTKKKIGFVFVVTAKPEMGPFRRILVTQTTVMNELKHSI